MEIKSKHIKTNIVHFRRKWKQQTTFKFEFENNLLNIVDRYKYLGVVLQENLDFKITEEVLAVLLAELSVLSSQNLYV